MNTALKLVVDKGFSVIPLHPNQKTPLTQHGSKDASNEADIVAGWAAEHPSANIGIATGAQYGLMVLDIDKKKGVNGWDSLAELVEEHGELPETLSTKTPTGGGHFYFRIGVDQDIRNGTKLRPGIDCRGAGGYVVAPPSAIDGVPYEWVNEGTPVADAPAWLITLVTTPKKSAATPVKGGTSGIGEGGRNDALMRRAVGLLHLNYTAEQLDDTLQSINVRECDPPLPANEVADIARKVAANYGHQIQRRSDHRYHLTDAGNATRFSDMEGHHLRYCAKVNVYYFYNGRYWEPVPETFVYARARGVAAQIHREAAETLDDDQRNRLVKFALQSEGVRSIDAMVKLLKSEQRLAVNITDFDAHNMIFPAANGDIDLTTGQLLPADPARMITTVSKVIYDPEAKCPLWERFIDQIFGGDAELIAYIKRMIGYCLTGMTSEQCIFFFYGGGRNGKSTFINLIQALLSSMAATASSDLLMERRGEISAGQQSELARLFGKRLAAMNEIEDRQSLSDRTVKMLTGGDAVTAKFMHKDIFEFQPRFKILMASNHKPTVRGTDLGMWRRMRLVPFLFTVPADLVDRNLEAKLRTELSGILNWAIEGCLEWQRLGKLDEPKVISSATDEYREDMDIIGRWLTEHFELDANHFERFDAMYKFFEAWSTEEYKVAYSKRRLSQALHEKGFIPGARSGRVYYGLRAKGKIELDQYGKFMGFKYPPAEPKKPAFERMVALRAAFAKVKIDEPCLADEFYEFNDGVVPPGTSW